VLVHESMVERADQSQVVQIGSATTRPPSDVVRMREPSVAAPGERARSVAMPKVTHHPHRRLARGPADADDGAAACFDDGLQRRVAEQPADRVDVEHRTAVGHGRRLGVCERLRLHVDDHARAIVGAIAA
jgi:hypothetical protein